MRNILLFIAISFSLQGCFVAGAAIGAAGVAAIYDHRKLEKIASDQSITNTVANKIRDIQELREKSHVEVTTFNKVVLLTGETPTAELRQQAESIASGVPGITRIYNQITIQGPTSSLTRTSDSWITTKIKTEMLATKNLKSGNIKVITENGGVYLMGTVSRSQADIAANIARQVAGVQRVVKIFQYTD